MAPKAITQPCSHCQMPLVMPETFRGKVVPCSRCGAAVTIGGASPQGLASPSHPATMTRGVTPVSALLPPSAHTPSPVGPGVRLASGGLAQPEALSEEPDSEETEPLKIRRRSGLYLGCMLGLLVLLVGVVVIGGVAVLQSPEHFSWLPSRERGNGGTGGERAGGTKINRTDYTDASRKAVGMAGVMVRIDRAETGKVHFRSGNENLETATSNYLIVSLNIKNKSRGDNFEYLSWYSYSFDEAEASTQRAELTDENGVAIPLFPVPGAERIENHGLSSVSLKQGDDLSDSLVFKLPDDYLDHPVAELFLKLPAAAVGEEGYFHFFLPRGYVRRRE